MITLEEKVEAVKTKVGVYHSAYKQSAMHLDEHLEGTHRCDSDVKTCVIEFEYNKIVDPNWYKKKKDDK